MQINCKILVVLIVLFSLVSCESKRTDKLIKSGFEINLEFFVSNHNSKIENGIVYIRDVNASSRDLNHLVDLKDEPKKRNFYHKGSKISEDSWGRSICRSWGDFDGVTRYAIYYPEINMVLLGYFSGMDE